MCARQLWGNLRRVQRQFGFVAAFAAMAVCLGEAMLRWAGAVASVDINPVIVFETGAGAVAVDALVECRL